MISKARLEDHAVSLWECPLSRSLLTPSPLFASSVGEHERLATTAILHPTDISRQCLDRRKTRQLLEVASDILLIHGCSYLYNRKKN